MKFSLLLASFLTVGLTSSMIHAQDNVLQDSLNGWLDGDDQKSLEQIAILARDGSPDAQIFLGQIDRDIVPGGTSTYLVDLNEEARDSLLRKRIDNRTRNWLLEIDDPAKAELGQLLFDYRMGRTPIETALELQKAGEFSAAAYLLSTMMEQGRFDLINSIPQDNYGLTKSPVMIWFSSYLRDQNKVITTKRMIDNQNSAKVAGLLAVERLSVALNIDAAFTDDVENLLLVLRGKRNDLPPNTDLISIQNSLMSIAEIDTQLGILARLCSKCEENQVDPDCMAQALEIIGGYRSLLKLRTPSDNVIAADDFNRSVRADQTIANLIRSRSAFYLQDIKSACLAALF